LKKEDSDPISLTDACLKAIEQYLTKCRYKKSSETKEGKYFAVNYTSTRTEVELTILFDHLSLESFSVFIQKPGKSSTMIKLYLMLKKLYHISAKLKWFPDLSLSKQQEALSDPALVFPELDRIMSVYSELFKNELKDVFAGKMWIEADVRDLD
jgi:hypothetical protein